MTGRNIGDMLKQKSITWGWFEGGFDLTVTNPNGTTGCARHDQPDRAGPVRLQIGRIHRASPAVLV